MDEFHMSFLYPSAFPPPGQSRPLRSSTLPVPIPARTASPPQTAPPVPNGSSSSTRNRPAPTRTVKLVSSIPELTPNIGALQDEIERLSAACEEHERKIRASRTTIEHRLFSELPHALSRLNEIDDGAESMTAQLQSTLQSLEPALQAKLADLMQEREADVETMRSRTTPWKTLIREEAEKEEKDGLATTRIERVDGLRTDDELARIERWAEEVEIYLTGEIVRLRQKLSDSRERKKWRLLGFLSVLIAAVAFGLISVK